MPTRDCVLEAVFWRPRRNGDALHLVQSTHLAGCVKPAARRNCHLPGHRRLATETGWCRLAGFCRLPAFTRKDEPTVPCLRCGRGWSPIPIQDRSDSEGIGVADTTLDAATGLRVRPRWLGQTSDRGSARAEPVGSPGAAVRNGRRRGRGRKRRLRSRLARRRSLR